MKHVISAKNMVAVLLALVLVLALCACGRNIANAFLGKGK